jgi:hypothetical protein
MANPTRRTAVMLVLIVAGALLGSTKGLIVGLLLSAALYATTLSSGGDRSAAQNWEAKRRWRRMVKRGYDVFRPVADRPVTCPPGSREWNAYRDFPDGADEVEFLNDPDPAATAILYHLTPTGDRYLTASFRVDGPLVGLTGDADLDDAQTAFGKLLAGWGSRQKLVTGLQITTRMLPPGTIPHEKWMTDQLDPHTPKAQVEDYATLLRKLSVGRYIARHYVTLRWDRTPRFTMAAREHGKGDEGWRALVLAELRSARQRLTTAGYERVAPLTGPQHAALVRHLQNPDYHPDQTADITAAGMYRPSAGTMTTVTTDDRWVHRTAQFPVNAIETIDRTGTWMEPLLVGMEARILRTVSLHIALIPSADAKVAAKRDATTDRAEQITDAEKGRLEDDDTEESLTAAQRRLRDMRGSSGHHGAQWTGFVTFTIPKGDSVPLASAAIEEAADTCGINRLDWLDSWQPAAQSLNWPMARGVIQPAPSRSAKALELLVLRSAS